MTNFHPRTKNRRPGGWKLPLASLPLLALITGGAVVVSTVVAVGILVTDSNSSHQPGAKSSPSAKPSAHKSETPAIIPSPTPSGSVPVHEQVKQPGDTTIGKTSPVDQTIDVIGSTSRIVLSASSINAIGPGVSSALDMAFTNEDSTVVSVNHVAITVTSVTAPQASAGRTCTLADFYVTQLPATFSVSLAGGARSSLGTLGTPTSDWPTIGMLNTTSNQDGCKGASLTLSYTAWGNNE